MSIEGRHIYLYRIAGKGRSVQSPHLAIQDVAIGTPISFLTWLIHEVCGRPLGLRQPTRTRQFMEMSLLNPSIALHGTVEGSRTMWPKRCLLACMRIPTCDSPALFWIETLVTGSCQCTLRILLWDFM